MNRMRIISPRDDNALTMTDVAVVARNTWRHVGSRPLDLSLLRCACHCHHHLALYGITCLDHVLTVSGRIGALAEVGVVSSTHVLSSFAQLHHSVYLDKVPGC